MSVYIGDYIEDFATLNFKFTSRNSSAVPTTLAGSPVIKVYKANATGTETATGVTLTVDFDGVTGLNNVLIDLSSDAFYAIGNDYNIVITTGTVGGVSVVGEVVGQFSIGNRFAGPTAVENRQEMDANSTQFAAIRAKTDLIGAGPTAVENRQEMDANSTQFAAIRAKTDQIGSITVTYSSPVAANGRFSITGGDSYLDADGRALTLVVEDYSGPSLVAATGVFRILNSCDYNTEDTVAADLDVAAEININGTTITLTADLTAAQTAALSPSPPENYKNYEFQYRAETQGGSDLTLGSGQLTVIKGIEE